MPGSPVTPARVDANALARAAATVVSVFPVKLTASVDRLLGVLTPPEELLGLLELADDPEELLKFVVGPL